MSRSIRSVNPHISAARWPLLLGGSVLLVLVAVAAPLVVYQLAEPALGADTATLVALATGIAMFIAIAVAWVVVRARREEEGL